MKLRNNVLLLAGIALSGPVFAEGTASGKETAGVGIGGVVGAVAGGPIGFVIGAASGAVIGDRWHRSETQAGELGAELVTAERQLVALEAEIDGLNDDIDLLGHELEAWERTPVAPIVELLETGIEIDVLFRTDEVDSAADISARLSELATRLADVPELRVRLDGYADPRGAEDYNVDLSMRRAESVKALLLDAGLEEGTIVVAGHGAVAAADPMPEADSLAFERRVSVLFYVDSMTELDDKVAGL